MEIIHLESVDSTNRYCELLDLGKVGEFTIVCAEEQTAGRGQQSHRWESQKGQNLTLSLILHPIFLNIADQFQLQKVLSLGLVDLLDSYHIGQVGIKWPNDIYVGSDKICGILVANKISRNSIQSSVCGIGLNVNQTIFPDWVPNPTSLALLKNETFHLDEVLNGLIKCISDRYQMLKSGQDKLLDNEYLAKLMNLDKPANYTYQGKAIRATITGVNRFGHLQLTIDDGTEISCQIGEISLIH